MEAFDAAVLISRLWLGVVMIAHGINHARTLEGTAAWFAKVGFRRPRLNALASVGTEIAVGIGLILGLLTSLAAAGLVATMVVAFWAIHRFAGFFVFHRPDEGYEYVVTLAVSASVLAMLGPGAVSVDSAIGLSTSLDGWSGLAIVLLGALAGVIQLAVSWRRPRNNKDPRRRVK